MTASDTGPDPLDHPPGPRLTANRDLVAAEAELRDGGVDLDNPAVPLWLFEDAETAADYREVAAEEADRDDARRHVIGWANRQARRLEEDGTDGESREVSGR